ncbi:transglutaminase domain-containing protein [Parafrankia elaeagni]|uniref:transglutaminase domain-containing protein n=1 Tax=Parafrankia elaeagni TaxID=222534 RepID=UPI00035DDB3B|nr:transglutaminase domain-containing protein [Parafrankia elaeagni]
MLGAASKTDLADGGEPGGPRRRAVQLVLVAALALVGGSGFTRLFPARDLWVPLPVAAVLPVILVGLLGSVQVRSRRRRRLASPAITVPVWVIGFIVWTAYTVAAGTGGFPARLAVVRTGVVDGWARLLDVAAPAPADPDLLIVAFAPTWLAAALGAELTLRTRASLAPALPAALTLVAATAVSLPAPGSNLPQAAALVAITAVYLLTRMPRTGRNDLAWQWARGAGATATVLAASVLVTVTVLGAGRAGDPVDPRDHRSVRPADAAGISPLAALSGWTAHPDEVLFRAEINGPGPDQPVTFRLAVLDSYDGVTWHSSARFVRAGDPIAPSRGDGADRRADAVSQTVDVVGLRGLMLPSYGWPTSGPPGAQVDPDSGMLLGGRPLAAGTRFEIVTRTAPAPDPAAISSLSAGSPAPTGPSGTAGADPDLGIPADPPPILGEMAELATARGRTPFERAALLSQYLSATFVFDPAVPPGHAYGHIEHFLGHTRRGTSEQFATTFVLAARLLGLPARLVVGFTAPPAPDGGSRSVHGSDALAWAEVRFDGVGWLPFFPTPRAADARGASVAGSNQGESPEQAELIDVALRSVAAAGTTGTESAAAPETEGDAGAADRGRRERSDSVGAWPPWVTPAGLALGGVTVLYLVLALLAAEARRRLRHAARARTRVVAAWEGAIEALTDAAVPVPAAASPGQVARLAATARVGPAIETDLAGLADLVTLALFAPAGALDWDGEPGTRTAAEAWRRLDQIERSLRRGEDRRGHARRIRRALLRALAPATVRAGLRGLRGLRAPAVAAVAAVATGLPGRDEDLSGRDDPSGGGGSPAGSAPDRDRIASPA